MQAVMVVGIDGGIGSRGRPLYVKGVLGWGGRASSAAKQACYTGKFVAVLRMPNSFLSSLLIFATNLMFGGGDAFGAPKTVWNFLPVLHGGYAHELTACSVELKHTKICG